jgi:hypothetical protein
VADIEKASCKLMAGEPLAEHIKKLNKLLYRIDLSSTS